MVGCAIALKEGEKTGDKSAVKAAENIGIGLQSFCIPGSVADDRKVGLGHDNMAAGPASYGMTDTMGRMHSDAQFAGSSSVPAHVEMMGFLGIGNNPMVGCSVACAVDVAQALAAKK